MSKAAEYAAKFNKVFDYIDKHLDEALSLALLSQVACFLKYHFHRQFAEYTGISIFKYVQLVLQDFPLYFHYLNLMPETAELDLMTDIYLPLK